MAVLLGLGDSLDKHFSTIQPQIYYEADDIDTDMKIALVNLGRTGAGPVYALEIAKVLSQKAALLSVISSQAENIEHWRKSGLNIGEVDTYSNFKEFVFNTLKLRSILQIRSILHGFNPDVIYTPMMHLWTPLIGIWFPHIPKILTIHDPAQHQGEQNLFIELIRDWSIKQSERIILMSKIFTNDLQKKGVPQEKIDIIPLGEFSYYKKISGPTKIANRDRPPTLLFFGRILPYKGLDILFTAFSKVKERVPDARLLVVGDGDLSPYRTLIEGVQNIVLVNDWIRDEDVGLYFEQADVVVLPYKDGTQSGVIPTAYMYHIPVIASRIGGLPEQLNSGETGLLVTPNHPDELAEACTLLLTNSSLAQKMGAAGYSMAQKEWSWEAIATKVLNSCRNCCKINGGC